MSNNLPKSVYIVTSSTQDTDGRHGHEEMEETHGVFESLEDANEHAISLLEDYYDSAYSGVAKGFIERWTKEEYIQYDDNGCLLMEEYPEEADNDPYKVWVTKHSIIPAKSRKNSSPTTTESKKRSSDSIDPEMVPAKRSMPEESMAKDKDISETEPATKEGNI
ncbi:hypothetical protein BJ508DRAFT_410398 [Ascobolus immersus RN42]|uniref:Uncharacterized protein n=1 Tax=Ascobolus immersus RN42 TaxID=1160509 RepID=A0A3N4INC1_ASCIM|nr:hypothetical protein BJ508DRAFT_410398 [Ascobolus immersus RN42]